MPELGNRALIVLTLIISFNLLAELGPRRDAYSLGQLQEIVRSWPDTDNLNLRVEYGDLTSKQAEEVFTFLGRLTNLRHLDLNVLVIDFEERSALLLAAALSKMTNLYSVSISFRANRALSTSEHHIFDALRELNNLTFLSFYFVYAKYWIGHPKFKADTSDINSGSYVGRSAITEFLHMTSHPQ